MDCLEGMREIPSGSVDLIVCDPPYGTIKGIGKSTDKFNKDTTWDVVIPTDRLFDQFTRILRNNGTLVLFSQEPYTMHLRTFKGKNLEFSYPMIWLKNGAGNPLKAKIAPLSMFEDISVWRKRVDIVSKEHPLREYARELVKYIGKNYQEVGEDFVRKGYDKPTRAQHFLAYDCNQFHLCTFETYEILTMDYNLRNWGGIGSFRILKRKTSDGSQKTKPGRILSLIYQMAQRAFPTSWSTVKTWIRSIPRKNPWRLLRTLYASTLTQGIPSWTRVWDPLQRPWLQYVPAASG